MRTVNSPALRSQSGLSLAEALITSALFCILIVPALTMIGQSAINYRRAFSTYEADLILQGLMAEARTSIELSNATIDFSKYLDDDRFESIVIIEHFAGQSQTFRYPVNSSISVQSASIEQSYFAGLITAAVKDVGSGTVKVGVMPF